MVPEGNKLPLITYDAKKVVAILDCKYKRFTRVLMTVSSIIAMNMRNWMFVMFAAQSGIRLGKMILSDLGLRGCVHNVV
jgi:hypothetical protein